MKEELLQLIEKIKIELGLNQGEISERAGYGANHIAVALAKNQVSRKLINNVKRVLNEKSIHVKDAAVLTIETQIELIATSRVILSILAEVQGSLQNRLPVDLASTYRRMVKDEATHLQEELRRK